MGLLVISNAPGVSPPLWLAVPPPLTAPPPRLPPPPLWLAVPPPLTAPPPRLPPLLAAALVAAALVVAARALALVVPPARP